MLSYGSKSYKPIRLHDFVECSFSLTNWLFGMCIVDIPSVLEVLPGVLEIEKETLFGETKLIFWSTGKVTNKIGSVGRQIKIKFES